MNEKYKILVIMVAAVTGLVIHGFLVGRAIQRFKKEDRSISVKGFSERSIKKSGCRKQ